MHNIVDMLLNWYYGLHIILQHMYIVRSQQPLLKQQLANTTKQGWFLHDNARNKHQIYGICFTAGNRGYICVVKCCTLFHIIYAYLAVIIYVWPRPTCEWTVDTHVEILVSDKEEETGTSNTASKQVLLTSDLTCAAMTKILKACGSDMAVLWSFIAP